MSISQRGEEEMNYFEAFQVAEKYKLKLAPYCNRIEIAGSIRRKRKEVGDIEIVCIRKEKLLFEPGIETILDQLPKVRGDAIIGKQAIRETPEGINLDCYFATKNNWGFIFAIRTGSAEFSHNTLAKAWVRNGYFGNGGMLYHAHRPIDGPTDIPEEKDLFKICGLQYIEPEKRI
jgi:DNA polymerase/3'-5' exonuclease PolX